MATTLTPFLNYNKQCAEALKQEQEHLRNVRGWLSNLTLNEAVGAEGLMEAEADGKDEEEDEKPKRKTSRGRAPAKHSSKKKRKK